MQFPLLRLLHLRRGSTNGKEVLGRTVHISFCTKRRHKEPFSSRLWSQTIQACFALRLLICNFRFRALREYRCSVIHKKKDRKTNPGRDLAQMAVHYPQLTGAKKTQAISVKHFAKIKKEKRKKTTHKPEYVMINNT